MIEQDASRAPAAMRRVNELVWESLGGSDRSEPVAFFCECSDSGCYKPAWFTLAEYEHARSDPEWVATASEHEATAGLVRIA
jgi:hypothetical protein